MASYVNNNTLRLPIALNSQYVNEGLMHIDVPASSTIAHLMSLIRFKAIYDTKYRRLGNIGLDRMTLWRVVFPYRTFYARVGHESVDLDILAHPYNPSRWETVESVFGRGYGKPYRGILLVVIDIRH
jgi:predicted transcriptional regulator